MFIYLYAIGFILAFGGLSIAKYIHDERQHMGHPLISPVGGENNAVFSSKYSRLFHFPIETIGALYYTIITLTYAAFFVLPELHMMGAALILIEMTVVAFLFSLYLLLVQIFVLKAWCPSCVMSVIICTLIFLIEFKFIGYDPFGLAQTVLFIK